MSILPKLNTAVCLLGRRGQKLSADPRCEFRCTGNKLWSLTCHSPASCPAHLHCEHPGDLSSGHCVAAVASACCQGNAAADEDADTTGCLRWPRKPGRQRGRNNLFTNTMLFISVAALEFWACTMQREFNAIWDLHLDTSLFLCQIIHLFSNQHGKNMATLCAQILYRKTYIPKQGG